jgi:hypothetical protein
VPRGVVDRAEHAGDVAQREVGHGALGQRAQRLALEVEQHPAPSRGLQHLAQVQVAVDALQRRQAGQTLERGGVGVERRGVDVEVADGRARPRQA